MTSRKVYFHEDDYCQIEVLPAQNWAYCAQQLQQIVEFSERHRAPNGMGWTDIFMRSEEPISLSTLTLEAERVSRLLSRHLMPFDKVETGYSSHSEECLNTRAFGFNADCVVYLSTTPSGIVDHLWLGLGGPAEPARDALVAALVDFSTLGELLFVDWGWGRLFSLSDRVGLGSYLGEREAHMKAFRERFQSMQQPKAGDGKTKAPWWKFWD